MKRALKFVAQLAVIAFVLLTVTQQASALVQGNVVYTGSEAIFGTGFGTLNNLLVLQGQGSATIETGIVIPGTPKDTTEGDATNQSEAYSFQELINLGITSAADLRLGFNVNETGNEDSTLNLLSFVLQVYNTSGTVVASTLGLDLTANPAGNEFDASTQQGQGKGAYLFVLDQNAIALLDPYFLSPTQYFLGASGSIDNINNGPDGWYVAEGTGAPVPEPGTIMLLGLGFFGLAVYGKRRKNA